MYEIPNKIIGINEVIRDKLQEGKIVVIVINDVFYLMTKSTVQDEKLFYRKMLSDTDGWDAFDSKKKAPAIKVYCFPDQESPYRTLTKGQCLNKFLLSIEGKEVVDIDEIKRVILSGKRVFCKNADSEIREVKMDGKHNLFAYDLQGYKKSVDVCSSYKSFTALENAEDFAKFSGVSF